jgi:hypothetical protein
MLGMLVLERTREIFNPKKKKKNNKLNKVKVIFFLFILHIISELSDLRIFIKVYKEVFSYTRSLF